MILRVFGHIAFREGYGRIKKIILSNENIKFSVMISLVLHMVISLNMDDVTKINKLLLLMLFLQRIC